MNSKDLMTVSAAAAMLGVSERTLRKLSTQEHGPQPIRLGRAVRYSKAALARWVEEEAPASHRARVDCILRILPKPDTFEDGDSGFIYEKQFNGKLTIGSFDPSNPLFIFDADDGQAIFIALEDLTPVGDQLEGTAIVKVIHSGGQQ